MKKVDTKKQDERVNITTRFLGGRLKLEIANKVIYVCLDDNIQAIVSKWEYMRFHRLVIKALDFVDKEKK